MSSKLADPAWGGIAGVIAILTFALVLYDRKKAGDTYLVRFLLSLSGFALIGASYGPLLMVPIGLVGDFLGLLGVKSLPQPYGSIGNDLANFQIGLWGFNGELSNITKQMTALGLWIGTALSALIMAYVGMQLDFELTRLLKLCLYASFTSIVLTLLMGAINGIQLLGG